MDPHLPFLNWIDDQHSTMCRRVMDWCNINSGTGNLAGLGRMAAEVRGELKVLDAAVEDVPLDSGLSIDSEGRALPVPLGKALRITKRPQSPLRVFAAIHMDTVYPSDHAFQSTTLLDQNTLRGPGVADAKGGLAVMLTALEALERNPVAPELGWEVLINPDEEIGSPGSAPLLNRAARGNHLGLVFEPALPGGALADRRRGVGNFTVVVRGRSAHSGRDFESGRNAVVVAAELAVNLHALNGVLPGVAVNVSRIEGGASANVVPELAVCRINVRTSAPEDETLIRDKLEVLVAAAQSRDGIAAELHGAFTAPPKLLDQATLTLMGHISECGRELGLPIEWKPSGGACDGNRLAAAGLPTVDSLGPRGGDLHSPTEYILLDSLTERAKLTALLLMKLASGEIPWPPR
jgi:glutamate carboxypeptidase